MSRYERQAGSWVYDELRRKIENLDYDPGQELQLVSLSQELGVSRSPVRDALLRLERDRLVDIFPQKGTRVSYLDRETIMQERFLRTAIELRVFDEFLDREYDEKGLLILVTRLRSCLLQQKTALLTGDVVAFLTSDIEFHTVFYDEVGYERILKVIQAHTGNEHRARLLNMKVATSMEGVYEEHEAMVDAIEKGDRKNARALLAGHFGKLGDELDHLAVVYPEFFTAAQNR